MQKLLVFVFLCLPALTFAQSSGGVAGISGTVHDSSGAVVPNANVTISSEAQGQIRSILTNEAGIFSAPGLPPGPGYNVKVEAAGFSSSELKGIELQVGQNVNLDVNIAVAQSATTVDVTAVAELVNETKTDVLQVEGER